MDSSVSDATEDEHRRRIGGGETDIGSSQRERKNG
jgi:hypothetical protein